MRPRRDPPTRGSRCTLQTCTQTLLTSMARTMGVSCCSRAMSRADLPMLLRWEGSAAQGPAAHRDADGTVCVVKVTNGAHVVALEGVSCTGPSREQGRRETVVGERDSVGRERERQQDEEKSGDAEGCTGIRSPIGVPARCAS